MSTNSNSTVHTEPLITVGLTTFNRVAMLARAIDSVLNQTYRNIELIISDNASADGTDALCAEYCRKDSRARYIRHPINRGDVANHKSVLGEARGEYFMWLADDDWLDPGYIEQCVRILVEQSDYQLVCGCGKYYEGDKFCFQEAAINLLQESGAERVLSYYRQVELNGMLSGVMRRDVLSSLEIRNVIGGDWLLMARMAFLGRTRTLENVFLNRSLGGWSQQSAEIVVSNFGLPAFIARSPFLLVAFIVFRDVAWKSRVYKPLRRRQRLSLAGKSAISIIRRFKAINSLERLIELRKSVSEFICDKLVHIQAKLILRTRLKRGVRKARAKISQVK